MNPNERTTGRMPEMLQDCDRKLSRALSNTPDARLHAREAAAAADVTLPLEGQPIAWGLFAFIEGEGWVLQFPVRATQAHAEQDRAMYAAGEKLQVLPLTAGVAGTLGGEQK
jgi:hypothetical protein